MNIKPTLVLDFDGTIHSYENGWQGGEIYGHVVPGFFEWAIEAKKYFILTIYSSRSAQGHKGIKPMQDWLAVNIQGYLWDHPGAELSINDFRFPTSKPTAFITIDDRAITFSGNWKEEKLLPIYLRNFKPWTETQPKGTDTNEQRQTKEIGSSTEKT